jgi:hypothetical protein
MLESVRFPPRESALSEFTLDKVTLCAICISIVNIHIAINLEDECHCHRDASCIIVPGLQPHSALPIMARSALKTARFNFNPNIRLTPHPR